MTLSDRRAAVIGAGGFIGAALTDALRSRQIPVTGYTRAAPFIDDAGRLHDDLLAADTVFWLASSIRPATTTGHDAAIAADHQALTRLLDGLRTAARTTTRVVAVSSGGTVYDPASPSPHPETAPLAPANAYGEAMLRIEALVRERAPEPVVLRVANAYGPGQPARRGQGVIAYWLTAVAQGEPVHVLGPDEVARDYVYIDDVVDALIRVHLAPQPQPVLNIGSGVPTSLRALLALVRDTVAPLQVDARHDPGRTFDAPSTWLDVSLAAAELEWKPTTDLTGGLRRTWQQLRAN